MGDLHRTGLGSADRGPGRGAAHGAAAAARSRPVRRARLTVRGLRDRDISPHPARYGVAGWKEGIGSCPSTSDEQRVPSPRVTAPPHGSIGYTSTGWSATLANGGGRPIRNYRTPPYVEARGWYTGAEYENARITTTLPSGYVSGVWTCNVNLAKGSGGTTPTRVLVSLDPRFHADPVDRGQVIFEQNGHDKGSITIDTRSLPDGVHRLFLRTDSTIASGTGSGALVVLFRVDNGGMAAAAPRFGGAVLDPTGPIMPWLMLLFALVINLPWRGTLRLSGRLRRLAIGQIRA
jgi:hypothetical protein